VSPGLALSLVIPAYNEQARLPYTLAEIEKFVCAEHIDCEVIVVDNGSQGRRGNDRAKRGEETHSLWTVVA